MENKDKNFAFKFILTKGETSEILLSGDGIYKSDEEITKQQALSNIKEALITKVSEEYNHTEGITAKLLFVY